jgi:hypothetical protein
MSKPQIIAYCSLAILVALYLVGAVSNGSLRHEVQTLPLWFPIVLGFRQSNFAKWTAFPCFIIWLTLMTFIWLFLLGWAKILSGHFSPVENRHDFGCRNRIRSGNHHQPSMEYAVQLE